MRTYLASTLVPLIALVACSASSRPPKAPRYSLKPGQKTDAAKLAQASASADSFEPLPNASVTILRKIGQGPRPNLGVAILRALPDGAALIELSISLRRGSYRLYAIERLEACSAELGNLNGHALDLGPIEVSASGPARYRRRLPKVAQNLLGRPLILKNAQELPVVCGVFERL